MIQSAAVARKPRPQADGAYALGYSDDEFRRLERQGDYYRDLTEDVLVRAGIGPGMRVLDLGCGVGDVALIAAGLVGPGGEVLGVDRSPEAMATAARRAEEAGQDGVVRFVAADLEHLRAGAGVRRGDRPAHPDVPARPGRDAAALRRLPAAGGVVAFHEMAMAPARSVPEGPLFRQSMRWIIETFARAGFETDMGGKLWRAFLDAGLPAPEMIAGPRGGRARRLRLRLCRADAAQPAAGRRAGGIGDARRGGARHAGRTAARRGDGQRRLHHAADAGRRLGAGAGLMARAARPRRTRRPGRRRRPGAAASSSPGSARGRGGS